MNCLVHWIKTIPLTSDFLVFKKEVSERLNCTLHSLTMCHFNRDLAWPPAELPEVSCESLSIGQIPVKQNVSF